VAAARDGREIRARELALLLAAARGVTERGACAVLVSGEAGIGKTHLARAAADALAADGVTVAWGRADPVERSVPYAAITQVLAALPARPRLGDRITLDGPRDAVRHDVFLPAADALEEACAHGPVVVVIDDLHHADEDTLVLLGLLVRRMADDPLAWVLTARPHVADPSPALTALLHGLREDRRLDEIPLAALDHDSVALVARTVIGRPLDGEVRDALVRRASGNPFFAIQLALSLADDGCLAAAATPGVLQSRRAALLERVVPLGEDARAVGRAVAVFGDIDLDQLDVLVDHLDGGRDRGHDGFDRLVRADLLRPRGDRYEFTHDLIRETLYDDLAPAARRRLHGVAATVLLAQRQRGGAVDVVELARHLSLASPGPDAAAADALREAGDVLLRASPRSAALRYRQAIGYLPPSGAGDLHVRLARALHRAGQPDEVARVCRRGLGDATGGERDVLTRYLSAALADLGDLGAARAMVEHEIATNGPSVVLLTTLALLHRLLDDVVAAERDIDAAAALVSTDRERLAVVFQRLNLGADVGAPAGGAAALADLERMLPSLDPETRLMAHSHAAGACVAHGEVGRGVRHLSAADELLAHGVVDVDWPWTFGARVAVEVATGRWDAAVASYERGEGEVTTGLRRLVRNQLVTAISDVALARGDVERLRRYVSHVAPLNPQGRRILAMARAKVDRAHGRFDDAVLQLEAALDGVRPHSNLEMYLLLALAATNERRGHEEANRVLLARFRADATVVATPWSDVLLRLLELRILGDVEAGQEGLRLAREHGNLRYEPDFRLHLGALGIDPADNLLAAYHQYGELGAVSEVATAEAALRRAGIRVPNRRRAGRFALTDAERRVAGLVAEGLSNKAIGERLAYSTKTIETYLSRIYVKTGSRNRVELARHVRAAG
jgi:DNA-binding CsgD family transcriptional regulator/type II secretory pathway predicted ATPase ExeA